MKIIIFLSLIILFLVACNDSNPNKMFRIDDPNPAIRETGDTDSLGKKTGKWVGYFPNKETNFIGYYLDGLKDSVWTFYDKIGRIEKTETYKSGKKNGVSLVYSDGVIYDRLTFVNDKKNGNHFHYYDSNSINFIQGYKDGYFDGDFILYYPDGKIKQKGQFEHGRCVGEWHVFSSSEKLIEKTIYDSLTSKYREIKYANNGEIISDIVK